MKRLLSLVLLLLVAIPSHGADERIYLSGKGLGDTVEWEFFCSEGRRSGSWQTIRVPSQWELEGFGDYCYGRWSKEARVPRPARWAPTATASPYPKRGAGSRCGSSSRG
jgi:hypothetical protein